MLSSGRSTIASAALAACALAALLASSSSAETPPPPDPPATVTVRIEGLAETKLPATQVTTTTQPVVKDGNQAHACGGNSALGALELATAGNWSGPWNSEFGQYEIFAIEGEAHPFEPGSSANYFWAFWLDEKESSVGACGAELQQGDRVLFFPACFGKACPPGSTSPTPLGIEAPSTANVGEAVPVTVKKYQPGGEASSAAGATVAGASSTASTDGGGHATLTFAAAGTFTLRVSAPEAVRTEATICVHNGNDGLCGTSGPSAPAGSSVPLVARQPEPAPYHGPFAVVAKALGLIEGHVYPRRHAPRVLAGTVSAHTAVTSVSISLRRRHGSRCFAFSGARAQFTRARCGTAPFFEVSRSSSFSYLLPAPLAPGRYVLDLQATDAAGNRTTLARGTSRIVFYVA